jgi:hypothetical protein
MAKYFSGRHWRQGENLKNFSQVNVQPHRDSKIRPLG